MASSMRVFRVFPDALEKIDLLGLVQAVSAILSRERSALFGQSLENSLEVANASAGNRLRIRTKVEDLYGDIALIAIFC